MKRKSLVLVTLLTTLVLIVSAGVSYACTLGVKDCKPSSPGSTTCYWWECQQTGSETTEIFTGTPCTCPVKKSENNLYNQVFACVQLPIGCTTDIDCTCSHCCSMDRGICKPTCN
jgi:hypothetical protein